LDLRNDLRFRIFKPLPCLVGDSVVLFVIGQVFAGLVEIGLGLRSALHERPVIVPEPECAAD
jgi:hypothetical protein